MTVEPKLIAEFVSDIWRLVVGRPIQPAPTVPPAGPGWAFACVQITGAWRGTVTVAAAPALVRTLAATVGGVSAERVTDADRTDALGELVGMIAGNLKAVLPPPCYMSKPAVAAGDGSEPAASRRRVIRDGYADPAGEFVVTVAETSRASARRTRRHPERPSGINPLSDCETSGRFPQILAEEYVVVNTPAPRGPATDGDSVR